MNEYETLMTLHDNCELIAQTYVDADDAKLAAFYFNAAIGFKRKAEKLTLTEIM